MTLYAVPEDYSRCNQCQTFKEGSIDRDGDFSPDPKGKTILERNNKLLTVLSPACREMVLVRCTAVPLPRHTILHVPHTAPEACYFLTSGMASIITVMEDGESAEVNVLGNEGVAGGLHLLGPSLVPTTCVMQLDGTGLRIPTLELRRLYDSVGEIRGRVLEAVQQQANLVSQIAGCNRLHEAEERLARWLLMTSDRAGSDELNFTQEFLAELLGARRTTVTMVAGAMQRSGLIEYRRGRVKILNREALKQAACECYQVTAELHQSLYRN